MKAKASKVIYAVSFIPLMWCIVMGICYGSSSSAGFLGNFAFAVLIFTAAIPLLPVCLIIQILLRQLNISYFILFFLLEDQY